MKRFEKPWSAWLLIGLCFALVFPLGSGVVEAKKGDSGGKCEGTKKQRKQKFDKRQISDAQFDEMIEQYRRTIDAEQEQMRQAVIRRVEREYEAHRATGKPFVYDVLIISGGGAKGAFGAGFLQGWGEIDSGPYARPEFDMVTGVSTGALISPFAFIGTEEAYEDVAEFYANPEPDWVRARGMIKFLPDHVSMYNNCHLQDTVRDSMDRSIVQRLAEGYEEDRLLMIGATNLDTGTGRVFELGSEAQKALEQGTSDRVQSILLASSALPGAFPPVEIDQMLYADGGATSNLFVLTFPGEDGPIAQFKRRHPEASLPKIRVWILVNQQLKPQHAVTQPRWIAISGRALDTLTRTSQLFALDLIRDLAEDLKQQKGLDAEWHLVSIPDDAPKKKTKEMFDRDYMRQLEDLGRKMGADPASWTNRIPLAYRVDGGRSGSE